jgi:hypothetical protein
MLAIKCSTCTTGDAQTIAVTIAGTVHSFLCNFASRIEVKIPGQEYAFLTFVLPTSNRFYMVQILRYLTSLRYLLRMLRIRCQ